VSTTRLTPVAVSVCALLLALLPTTAASQTATPGVPTAAPAMANPDNRDMNALPDLASWTQFSQVQNFDVLGHSYLRGAWLAPGMQGAGINTLRICGNTAYMAGYPPSLFGALVVDVSNPASMEVLAFIPGNPGTRNAYLRVNCDKKILALGEDTNSANPNQPPAGERAASGVAFYDVSDPANPIQLSMWANNPGGSTHGMEMDDRYVYACGSEAQSNPITGQFVPQVMSVLDYADPANPRLASTFHVPGQLQGEAYSSDNQLNPDGVNQWVTCHEIIKDGNRLYLAYRDAGVLILDISDPTSPVQVANWDFVPPYNGDPGNPLGCCPGAHTAAPVPHEQSAQPNLLVLTDEHFNCPPGFGRILDISDPSHITLLSTFHMLGIDDQYDWTAGRFTCPTAQESTHLPFFDPRGHGSLVYQAWYDQGLRVLDISNPYYPVQVGFYISPDTTTTFQVGRHTREAYVDPASGLVYVTDGNNGGVTILRYTGPMPQHPPLPGVR
jgi:hypothetical protein